MENTWRQQVSHACVLGVVNEVAYRNQCDTKWHRPQPRALTSFYTTTLVHSVHVSCFFSNVIKGVEIAKRSFLSLSHCWASTPCHNFAVKSITCRTTKLMIENNIKSQLMFYYLQVICRILSYHIHLLQLLANMDKNLYVFNQLYEVVIINIF